MTFELKNPSAMEIRTKTGTYIGGTQDWYEDRWKRTSGCGPTAASNQMWYLSRTRDPLKSLCGQDYRTLQDTMFEFVTPGIKGVDTAAAFSSGSLRYAESMGASLTPYVLEVPRAKNSRPSESDLSEFVQNAMTADCPVAFLNLSNGELKNLDNWHWVTVIAFDSNNFTARISDCCKVFEINLRQWLKTSMFGGGFVYFRA